MVISPAKNVPVEFGLSCLLLTISLMPAGQILAEEKASPIIGDSKPLWEVGVGGFAGWLPDYPAAGQNTARAIALPYIIYRGDILRVGGENNRGAISGRLLKNDRYEFDISLSAAFPVDSGSNDARRGMPDLDFLFGVGPQLIVKLINEPGDRQLDLNLQARAVYSTDFSSIDSRGFVFNPKLSFSQENVSELGFKVFASAGPIFATEQLMDYFYQVDSRYVTADRPAYDADPGYLGSNITLGLSKRLGGQLRLVFGARIGIHNGAANSNSPLFEDDLNLGLFSAFAWSFAQSEKPAR